MNETKKQSDSTTYNDSVRNDALLQDKLEAAMMSLKLSLEDHYTDDDVKKVINLIKDIYHMMLEQERRRGMNDAYIEK